MDKTPRRVVVTLKGKTTVNVAYIDKHGDAATQGVDVSLEDLRASGPDGAEARIGAAVLALLERISEVKLGLRDYEHATAIAMAEAHKAIAGRAKTGDPAAQNAMGLKCLEDGLATRDLTQLESAERWFKKAAKQGYKPAKEFLAKSWPNLKASYRRRIEGPSGAGE